MTYEGIVASLVCEVGPLLDYYTFNVAFSKAPSFPKLLECEVLRARNEVASKLGKKGGGKRKRRNHLVNK